MLNDNTYAGDQAAWPVLGTSRDAMNVRLNENDRRSVDMLLSGDGVQSDGLEPAMLERVNSVRRFLTLLDAMPADEPRTNLADAILQKITASTAGQQDDRPSASL